MYWITANWLGTYHKLFQIAFYDFHIPKIVVYVVGAAAVATSGATIFVFLRKDASGGGLPLNGVMAYVVTLYLWFFFGQDVADDVSWLFRPCIRCTI